MRSLGTLLLVGLCLTVGGCLEREMTITSQPPGALVYVSDVEVGRTPVTLPFTWYGDYDIIVRLDGYQTLQTHASIYPPIQETPPWDLLAEIAPWTFTDRRYLHFDLHEATLPDDGTLIQRAEQMRGENLQPVKR
ncbi:MAG: PEGA domain-containing protein [Phycisphaerae bacterium]|nr:PEGA domain-containing protein [Phycisphaerae bacterium]